MQPVPVGRSDYHMAQAAPNSENKQWNEKHNEKIMVKFLTKISSTTYLVFCLICIKQLQYMTRDKWALNVETIAELIVLGKSED